MTVSPASEIAAVSVSLPKRPGIFPLTDARSGAMEYGLGRTGSRSPKLDDERDVAVVIANAEPLSANAQRTAAFLLGLYLGNGDTACDPRLGRHGDDCPLRRGRMFIVPSAAARRLFGHDGGSQVRQIEQAIEELASQTSRRFEWDPARRSYLRETSHVLSYRLTGRLPDDERPDGVPDESFVEIAWDPMLLDALLAGRYQTIPLRLVQELRGRRAFRVWLPVLLQPGAAAIAKTAGASREFSVTGPRPTIPLRRIGLAGLNRRAKVRAALAAAAERGNAAQDDWTLAVVDRAGGGLKLRLTRRQIEDARRQIEDAAPANRGHSPGKSRTRSGSDRALQTYLETDLETGSEPIFETDDERAAFDAALAAYDWQRATSIVETARARRRAEAAP